MTRLMRLADAVAGHLGQLQRARRAISYSTWDHDARRTSVCCSLRFASSRPLWFSISAAGRARLIEFHAAYIAHRARWIDRTRARMAREVSGCEVVPGFLHLDLADITFDGIFANATLQHILHAKSCRAYCANSSAALKTGGGVPFALSIPHGDGREGWNNSRCQRHHAPAAGCLCRSAGLEKLNAYFRPEGAPRDQQPGDASVWRRAA